MPRPGLPHVLWLALALAGCGDPYGPIAALPRELTRAEQRLVEADNRFALKLFRATAAEASGNVFVSPLSVAMALGMTYNGANGDTEAAMRAALELGDLTLDEVNQAYRSLIDLLLGLDPRVEMRLANSIWYRQGVTFTPDFFDRTQRYFGARVSAIDFASSSAVATINDWVSRETRGKIPRIIQSIDPLDVMYLINAVYFKGAWRTAFDPAKTRDQPFFLRGGTETTVPMMTGHAARLGAYSSDELLAVDLPYGGGAFSMTVLVPVGALDLDGLVGTLPDRWPATVGALTDDSVIVVMPKFKLEWEGSMKPALTALGMGVAFDDRSADFTRLRPIRDTYISKVLHRTFVEVNEQGTEAAAVTAVVTTITCACGPRTIRVDRPFLFAIRERYSGAIMFIGKVERP